MDKGTDQAFKVLARLPVASVVIDLTTGVIIWANPRDLGIIGATSPEHLVGHNLLDFLDPSEHGVALRDLERVVNGESPPSVVYRVKRADGGRAWVRIASTPMRYGEKPAMLSLIVDVSERESLIATLGEREQCYRQLVEMSPDGIVVAAQRQILYANPAIVAAVGAGSADELLGRSMYDFIAPEERKLIRDARKHVLATGDSIPPTPATLVGIDGRRVRVTAATTRVTWRGEPATQTVMREFRPADEPCP